MIIKNILIEEKSKGIIKIEISDADFMKTKIEKKMSSIISDALECISNEKDLINELMKLK